MKVREMPKILVVDDEVGIRELLSEILRDEGHDVVLAENATEARTAREAGRPGGRPAPRHERGRGLGPSLPLNAEP